MFGDTMFKTVPPNISLNHLFTATKGLLMDYFFIYLGIINIIAIILTIHDKNSAKKRSWRVKERTLLIVSIIGGSVAMFLTMLAIRHKTKHAKFMVGIPVIIILQIAAVLVWVF